MGRDHNPVPGQWYESLDDEEVFQVLSIDEDAELIELQYEDGDVEEIDYETWQELDLDLTEAAGRLVGLGRTRKKTKKTRTRTTTTTTGTTRTTRTTTRTTITATVTTTEARPEPAGPPPVQAAGRTRKRLMKTLRLIAPACLLARCLRELRPGVAARQAGQGAQAHRDVAHQRLRVPVDDRGLRRDRRPLRRALRLGPAQGLPRRNLRRLLRHQEPDVARRRGRRPQRADLRLRPRLDRLPNGSAWSRTAGSSAWSSSRTSAASSSASSSRSPSPGQERRRKSRTPPAKTRPGDEALNRRQPASMCG